GLTLTVADLVYLIRVIVGDAVPYPNSPIAKWNPISADLMTMNGNLSAGNDLQISAAYVELRGNVHPELLAPNMNMTYNSDGLTTKVLVHAPFENTSGMESFSGSFLNVGGAEILAAEFATVEGVPVHLNVLPSEFSLMQNYPNPFNPSTTIEFALPVASKYNLTVYNVTGQVVAEFSGFAEAGVKTITWNAALENASGVYFYRLATDNFTETKKMVLLK
ncbi:T9SS type A sorting domain-containing protein, partial [candidate division GN15 bacterium]|nr:T9SS type A sorting domain-containing protein [candidate division GN15 bacterium]